jgi:chemotaxis protein MotB
MARKRERREDEPPAGLPPWMATFSDMVTLLLTFFVMLMAMANFEDPSKVDAVILSIRKALGVDGHNSKLINSHKEEAFTAKERREESLQPTVARLRQAFAQHISDHFIKMEDKEQEVRVRLDERVFFRPGSSELHPAAYALLADVGTVLADTEVDIRIEGYADGLGTEQKNWEVSADRSLAVVMALRDRGPIPGDRLEAVAFGAFHPGAEFGEGVDWNRRIEIVLRTDDVGGADAARRMLDVGEGHE